MPPKTARTTLSPPYPLPIPATNTPIDVLNDDVLLRIFSLNADMRGETMDSRSVDHVQKGLFHFKALFVTWRTSQVSRHWRDLMLVSPTIWGNVIDLTLLRGDKSEWRDEVLRRSRSSLLSIKGFISLHNQPTWYLMRGETLHTLLHGTWERLRSLDIAVAHSDMMSDESWTTLLCRHSRYLESFSVDLDRLTTFRGQTFEYSGNLDPIDFTLFSDFAPALRTFSNNLLPTPSFVKSSWFSQIRALTLCVPENGPGAPTPSQILSILKGLPCLEALSITTPRINFSPSTNRGYTSPVSILHLPYLQFISFERINFEAWTAILDCISPKPGCSLTINSCPCCVNPRRKNMLAVFSTLSRYSNAFMSSHSPIDQNTKKLRIQVLANGFSLSLENTQRYHTGNLDTDYFSITFTPPELFNFGSVFSALPSPILEATTELHLSLHGCCVTRNPRDLDPQFIRFLSSFTSVETLTTEDLSGTLAALLKFPEDVPMIFPSLRTLKLRMGSYNTGGSVRLTAPYLFSFLRRRKALGVPIQTLEIMDIWMTPYENALKLLDAELKVVWKDGKKTSQE